MSCCLAPTKPSPKSIIMRFNWNARIKWDFAEMFISMLVFLEMLVHKVPCTDLAHNEREKKNTRANTSNDRKRNVIHKTTVRHLQLHKFTNKINYCDTCAIQLSGLRYGYEPVGLKEFAILLADFFSEFSLSLSFYTFLSLSLSFAMHENIQHERKSHTILIVKQRLRLVYLGNLGAHWVHSACKPGVIFVTEIIYFFSFSIKVIK